MSRKVHVVRGDAAAGCMKIALGLKASSLLVSFESLSCGPLLGLESLEEWHRVRANYWRSLDTDPEGPFELAAEFDLLRNIEVLRRSESIVLWIGTGPDEQLLLVWMVQFLRAISVDLERLRVVQFDGELRKGFEVF